MIDTTKLQEVLKNEYIPIEVEDEGEYTSIFIKKNIDLEDLNTYVELAGLKQSDVVICTSDETGPEDSLRLFI